MLAYLDSLDIANRALQHLGVPKINDVDEDSRANTEVSFAYDKLRRAELRRNIWTFATRKVLLRAVDTTTKLLDPREWSETVTYLPGAIVKDANGSLWQSMVPDNLGNEPNTTAAWDAYFGPMSVHLYDEDTEYHTGELVYVAGDDPGSYVVFMSLINENESDPTVGDAWDVDTTYGTSDIVTYSGSVWRSAIEFNIGVTPADAPLPWVVSGSYVAADTVTGSDGYIYTAVGSTIGDDPVSDGGANWTNSGLPAAWTREPTQYESATSWRPIYAAIRSLGIQYPIGAGPASQFSTNNVFRLPNGFIRTAPADPKAGAFTALGGPSGLDYSLRNIEGDYFVAPEGGVVFLRFVADITDVTKMDDMFCEGLAARIGYEICEPVTQSTGKQGACGAAYNKFMTEARMVNAVEIGPIEQPEDDYLACRR